MEKKKKKNTYLLKIYNINNKKIINSVTKIIKNSIYNLISILIFNKLKNINLYLLKFR